MECALALVLHAHQPVENFDHVIESTYQTSYWPFLQTAARRPWLKLNLHYSGYLLDWLAQHHPEYLEALRALLAEGRLELLGGGYYEPILAVIPGDDQQRQLHKLRQTLETHFAVVPRGAWLAERVWEPELPAVLAAAGIQYTLLDDAHFELAGIAPGDVHGAWITEDQGSSLRIVPSNLFLRQAMPFREVSASLDYLRRAGDGGAGLLTMGDDLEKFGSWPHTFERVYGERWLEDFLDRLEENLEPHPTVLLGDYLERHPARGLLYVPTASYPEMMRWAGSSTWRGFLTKYPESNLLHKTVWDLHRRLAACDPAAPGTAAVAGHLLAAECNDVYWHGWFGGLYAPHLRNVAFRHLIAADRLLEEQTTPQPLRRLDLRGDGTETLELRTPTLRLVLSPSDGATLEELDVRPRDANLINSIQRRQEPYHQELRQRRQLNPAGLPTAAGENPASPEGPDYLPLLRYDRFPRSAGRLYLCPPPTTFADLLQLGDLADAGAAGGAYAVEEALPGRVTLHRQGVRKSFRLAGDVIEITVTLPGGCPPGVFPVLELILNLLAPDAADRGFVHHGRRLRVDAAAALEPDVLRVEDGWRRLAIELSAPAARAWWLQPVYTISQTDSGIETLYQGTSIAAVWPPQATDISLQAKFFL